MEESELKDYCKENKLPIKGKSQEELVDIVANHLGIDIPEVG